VLTTHPHLAPRLKKKFSYTYNFLGLHVLFLCEIYLWNFYILLLSEVIIKIHTHILL
jgi:hypothetical protein